MQLSHFVWMGGVVLVGTFIAGCAAEPTQPTAMSCGNNYTCLQDATFHYRQQAVQLSALAERYEIEAEAKAKELGQEAEQVKRQRDLAKEYRSEAQQADELARQYRSQLPHNVVY